MIPNWLTYAPGLGDSCLDSGECLLATRNSVCSDEEPSGAGNGFSWPTSSASPRRCRCAPGFAETPDRLECKLSEPLVSLSSSSSWSQTSGQAEQQLISGSAGAADVRGAGRNASKVSQGSAQDEPEAAGASSLGKPCSSSAQCKRRDPNSACINGICECSRPTNGCSSNSTGCHKDTFQCRSGQCISWYFVCDQVKNCDDGSDEQGCQLKFACPPEAFQCLDGSCLPRAKLCNGKRECSDGSDEFQCSASNRISSSPWPSLAVNSSADTRERRPAAGRGCHPGAFECADGQCLPAYVFCNAVEDCSDGSDEREQLCDRSSLAASRPAERQHDRLAPDNDDHRKSADQPAGAASGESRRAEKPGADNQSPLVKLNRESINKMLAALNLAPRTPESRGRRQDRQQQTRARRARLLAGAQQHSQGRREHVRAHEPAECPRWAFTCHNGKCRSSAILCSGVDGCGDQSDENHCEVCMCAPAAA